jgi:hypothetical protein
VDENNLPAAGLVKACARLRYAVCQLQDLSLELLLVLANYILGSSETLM